MSASVIIPTLTAGETLGNLEVQLSSKESLALLEKPDFFKTS